MFYVLRSNEANIGMYVFFDCLARNANEKCESKSLKSGKIFNSFNIFIRILIE